jgi:Na+/H+ antiporter NhaD/arsenite permease-like protein
LGDVTTTMLWIGGQITALGIVLALLLASVANMLVPLFIASRQFAGRSFAPTVPASPSTVPAFERYLMFCLGLGLLVLVLAFKQWTHPLLFMGILFGLDILWLAGELVHKGKERNEKERKTIARALSRIDLSSIVLIVGILFAVGALEQARILAALAGWLDRIVGRDLIVMFGWYLRKISWLALLGYFAGAAVHIGQYHPLH